MNFSLPDSILLARDLHRLESYLSSAISGNRDAGEVIAGSPQLGALVETNRAVYEKYGLKGMEKGVEEVLKIAPVFDVIFAASPHDTFMLELGRWFRASVHPQSLLKVSVRRSIGGGMVLKSKNKIFDFSLRPKILDTKQKIPGAVKNV